jgi:hypothetical protein
MPKRIDVGGEGSHDDLEEALRQLQRGRRPAAGRPREEVQEAVREIAEQQKAVATARRGGVPAWAKWAAIIVVVAAVAVAVFLSLRKEPLPPPAASAPEAVTGFWQAVIGHKYEAATVYYPSLVDKYGSLGQAAEGLKEHFGENPPVKLSRLGEPEQVPDSADVRISYEIYLRSGTPRSGDAIVTDTGDPQTGFVIVAGI